MGLNTFWNCRKERIKKSDKRSTRAGVSNSVPALQSLVPTLLQHTHTCSFQMGLKDLIDQVCLIRVEAKLCRVVALQEQQQRQRPLDVSMWKGSAVSTANRKRKRKRKKKERKTQWTDINKICVTPSKPSEFTLSLYLVSFLEKEFTPEKTCQQIKKL